MIFDSLDLMNPKQKFTAAASYYPETVDDPSDGGQEFNYEYVDAFSHTYKRLFGNIQSTLEAGECAIRTDDQIDFANGGYIVTQDGATFQIIQWQKDFSTVNKQAMRLLGVPVSVQRVIRMVQVPNPWGVK